MTIVWSVLWALGQFVCGFVTGAFLLPAMAIGIPTAVFVMLLLTGWADNFKMWLWLLKVWPLMFLLAAVCAGMVCLGVWFLQSPVYPFILGALAGIVAVAGLADKWKLV